jgi:hypothetical protein
MPSQRWMLSLSVASRHPQSHRCSSLLTLEKLTKHVSVPSDPSRTYEHHPHFRHQKLCTSIAFIGASDRRELSDGLFRWAYFISWSSVCSLLFVLSLPLSSSSRTTTFPNATTPPRPSRRAERSRIRSSLTITKLSMSSTEERMPSIVSCKRSHVITMHATLLFESWLLFTALELPYLSELRQSRSLLLQVHLQQKENTKHWGTFWGNVLTHAFGRLDRRRSKACGNRGRLLDRKISCCFMQRCNRLYSTPSIHHCARYKV